MASIAEDRPHNRVGIDVAAASIALMLGLSGLLTLYHGYAAFTPLALLAGAAMLLAALVIGAQGYRRRKESAIEAGAMMHAIAEALPQPVIVKDLQGDIVFANTAARARLASQGGTGAAKPDMLRLPWRAGDGSLLGWVEVAAGREERAAAFSMREVDELVAQRTAEVRELIAEIESRREEEKKILARKLHGDLGSSLTALSMHLAILSRQMPDTPALHERVTQMKELLGAAAATARRIQSGLRPDKLELFGMKSAIEDLADSLAQSTGIACILHLPDHSPVYGAHLEIALYRMLEEVLRNVTLHAYATQVDITMEERDDAVLLIVRDNGVGFSPQELPHAGYGLRSLRERAAYLGGKAVVQSAPGAGTQISIMLSLLRQAEALRQAS